MSTSVLHASRGRSPRSTAPGRIGCAYGYRYGSGALGVTGYPLVGGKRSSRPRAKPLCGANALNCSSKNPRRQPEGLAAEGWSAAATRRQPWNRVPQPVVAAVAQHVAVCVLEGVSGGNTPKPVPGVSGIFGRDGAVSGVLLGVVVCLGVEAALTRHGRAAHRDT